MSNSMQRNQCIARATPGSMLVPSVTMSRAESGAGRSSRIEKLVDKVIVRVNGAME